jgi:hypothetical protein
MLLAALPACASPMSRAAGAFVEEFDGFPIFHGDPGHPYRVLGGVYRPETAGRGTSAVKRAAVAEARRLGANAILLPAPPTAGEDNAAAAARESPPAGTTGAAGKWATAVAIHLAD